jgi:hypothetical protein
VGNWYRVTKRISGRLYDYWQRTYRVGKVVKTENKYIGPASRAGPTLSAPDQYEGTVAEHREYLANGVFIAPPAEPPEPELDYWDDLSADEKHEIRAFQIEQKRELEAYEKRRAKQVRAIKRTTKGIKSVNTFLAQALVKKSNQTQPGLFQIYFYLPLTPIPRSESLPRAC